MNNEYGTAGFNRSLENLKFDFLLEANNNKNGK